MIARGDGDPSGSQQVAGEAGASRAARRETGGIAPPRIVEFLLFLASDIRVRTKASFQLQRRKRISEWGIRNPHQSAERIAQFKNKVECSGRRDGKNNQSSTCNQIHT